MPPQMNALRTSAPMACMISRNRKPLAGCPARMHAAITALTEWGNHCIGNTKCEAAPACFATRPHFRSHRQLQQQHCSSPSRGSGSASIIAPGDTGMDASLTHVR